MLYVEICFGEQNCKCVPSSYEQVRHRLGVLECIICTLLLLYEYKKLKVAYKRKFLSTHGKEDE